MIFKKGKPKIFCISMQRTGTTSVGEFFKMNNYKVANWQISRKNKWSYYWERGDFESIFNSQDFINYQVFEDGPWWATDFYKVLYHRFPDSKFILFTRDKDEWFQSMLNHSGGKILGNTKIHCKVYRRESDFYNYLESKNKLDYDSYDIDNLLSLEGYENHYKKYYETRNREIILFFKKIAPQAFFQAHLTDKDKWQKLGYFFQLDIPENIEIHKNKSI